MAIEPRIIMLQTDRITVRAGGPAGNCKRIEEVAEGVFDIFGMHDRAVVRVYREPGMIVEHEDNTPDIWYGPKPETEEVDDAKQR